jgi:hypothetical protein
MELVRESVLAVSAARHGKEIINDDGRHSRFFPFPSAVEVRGERLGVMHMVVERSKWSSSSSPATCSCYLLLAG